MSFIGVANGFIGLGGNQRPASYYGNLPGSSGDNFSTSDFSQGATTTLEWAYHGSFDDVTPATTSEVIAQWGSAGNYGSILRLQTNGRLMAIVSTTGSNTVVAAATAALPYGNGELFWLRCVVDVLASTATFSTSPDPQGTPYSEVVWTQLGSVVSFGSTITAGIFSSTADLELGERNGSFTVTGKVNRALAFRDEVLAWDYNPRTDYSGSGSTMTSGSTGEVWTANGNASFVRLP